MYFTYQNRSNKMYHFKVKMQLKAFKWLEALALTYSPIIKQHTPIILNNRMLSTMFLM